MAPSSLVPFGGGSRSLQKFVAAEASTGYWSSFQLAITTPRLGPHRLSSTPSAKIPVRRRGPYTGPKLKTHISRDALKNARAALSGGVGACHTHNKMATMVVGRLVLLALVARSRGQRGTKDVQLAERAPREGTQCAALVARCSRRRTSRRPSPPAVRCPRRRAQVLRRRGRPAVRARQGARRRRAAVALRPCSAHWERRARPSPSSSRSTPAARPRRRASPRTSARSPSARAHVPEAQRSTGGARAARRDGVPASASPVPPSRGRPAARGRRGAARRASRDAGQQILLDELRALRDAHRPLPRAALPLERLGAAAADGGASARA